jgi:uncharacterized protein YbdZ (MbtH family)
MNSHVDQPINSTNQYIKRGVCDLFMHRSSFNGTNRCNLCKIDRNSEKRHCIICESYVVPSGWSQHCKTKKHRLNMATAKYNW